MTPSKILDQRRFEWIPSSQTNIVKTWERFGFIRPSKNPWFHEKWEFYRKGK